MASELIVAFPVVHSAVLSLELIWMEQLGVLTTAEPCTSNASFAVLSSANMQFSPGVIPDTALAATFTELKGLVPLLVNILPNVCMKMVEFGCVIITSTYSAPVWVP